MIDPRKTSAMIRMPINHPERLCGNSHGMSDEKGVFVGLD